MNPTKQTRIYNPPKSYATNNKQNKEQKRLDASFFAYINSEPNKEEPLTWERWASGIPGLRRLPWWDKADEAQEICETVEDKLENYEPLRDNEFLKRHGWRIKTSIKPDMMNPKDTNARLEFRNESDKVVSYPVGLLYKAFLFPLKPFVGTAEAKPTSQ